MEENMKLFQRLIAVAVCVTAMAGATGTAHATTTTPNMATIKALVNRVSHAPNPKAAFNKLSSADKKLYREATTPYGAPKILGAKPLRGMFSPAYTGCWGHRDGVEYDNVFGMKLADGYQTTNICVHNGVVDAGYPTVDNVLGTGAWAWSWDRDNTASTTDNAGWEGRGAVRFAYTVAGTLGDAYLCLRIFVNANGYNWRKDGACEAWS
jgi:hypothetical protein